MSIIPLASIKQSLRYTQDSDDAMLQRHLDASEGEAVRFLNRLQLPTLPQTYPPILDDAGAPLPEDVPTDETLAPEIYSAVVLLVQAKVDALTPDEMMGVRRCAETLLWPFRVSVGV